MRVTNASGAIDTARRRVLVLAGGVVGLTSLAGCSDVANTPRIEITSDGFDPQNTQVEPDQPVMWVNVDDEPHTVVSASPNWDLEVELQPDESTSYEFSSGTYDVVCSDHGDPDEFTGERMRIAVDQDLEDPV